MARVRASEQLAKLELEDLNLILRERRLGWFGHVERSSGGPDTKDLSDHGPIIALQVPFEKVSRQQKSMQN